MKNKLDCVIWSDIQCGVGDPIVNVVRDNLEEGIDENTQLFVAKSIRMVCYNQIDVAIFTHINEA